MSAVAPTPAGVVEPTAAGPERQRRLGLLLAVCCAAQFMVILDLSIVNVALPSIQSSLGFTPPELQWVVDAYAISFAGFLMFGGRAADHFGQRRMFVLALLLFGLASLAGGLAGDRTTLVLARAGQGIGGALMAACSLAIITASFEPGPQLHRAIGAWAAMNGLGGAAGMLFGGIITEALSWRWVLLINPPIGVAAAIVAYAVVTERKREHPGSFDVAGALTLTVGQLVLVYGVVEAGLSGWDTAIALGPIFGGIALLVLFALIEVRWASQPLIPFKELTRPLRVANNIVLLFSASLFPMWFISSLYLQQVLGLSPLDTGLIFLPMTLMIMAVAGRAGKLVGRFGVKPVLAGGLIMLSAGMFLLARIGATGSGVVYIMIPGLLTAAGIAMSIVPSTIAATQGAKPGQAGLASGLVNTSRQIGGGLGLAILVTLATERSTHLIGNGVQVPQALTEGFRLAYLICGGLAAAAALMTFVAMRAPATQASETAQASGGEPKAPALARTTRARQFSVAVLAAVAVFVALDVAFANSHGAPVGAYTTKGAYSFVSAPGLHPPVVKSTGREKAGSPPARTAPAANRAPEPYVLTANFYNLSYPPIIGQSGPLILDGKLQPVWFEPVPEKVVASNLAMQSYEGKPVLSWWQGLVTNTGQTLSGEDVIVDQHYRPIARLKGAAGWVLTLHEFLIDGQHAWVTANKNIALDLSPEGGAYNGALIDSAVQEYDLKSGRLLRSWDALKHISLRDSYATLPTNGFPWDAYHVNSIQLLGHERLLVSMRNTWAAYLVNAASGQIEWTLGGKRSDYRFGAGAAFQWQHDVTMPSTSLVSMYDDHCCQITSGGKNVPATGDSRALMLRIDSRRHTATLISQRTRERGFAADYMGDAQPLPGGGVFVGWGSEPYFSEYDSSGRLVLDAELPWPDVTYRATLARWVGLPLALPAGAARRTSGATTVYASWNGATKLASWRVLAAASAGAKLAPVKSVAKSGFETAVPVPSGQRYATFQLQALDAHGHVLGSSAPFSATTE
ncbi:MAG TPA: MFS transporter [Solirubrobacteraceae bacterium]|nr:MFS transporter [Solirubrobacteraceae bacterium]